MESVKKFEREERYLIVKISKLADDQGDNISRSEQIFRIAHFGKALVNAVVVEEDWPEHEPVWQMIERRMGGKPAVTAAEELAAVLHWRGKHDQAIKERNALQLLLNDRDDREEQITSLEQRRHAEQQACQAAERRVEELGLELDGFAYRLEVMTADRDELLRKLEVLRVFAKQIAGQEGEPYFARLAEAALNPTAEAVSHVDCGSCRNITDGCKDTCQRSEEWSKP